MEERVVLVDERDRALGTEEKLAAHESGTLHRGCSVLLDDGAGRVLLQQRALTKYHSPGLWSNTCCTHPRPGETPAAAAHRRLWEEMGIECELRPAFTFVYRSEFDNGLVEHEYDHVFLGRYSGDPDPNPEEVGEWRWIDFQDLVAETASEPERYSVWFVLVVQELVERGMCA